LQHEYFKGATVLVTGATGAVGPGVEREIFDLGFMIADLKNRESG
jgi:FlaA1/EpsC-like NDP-sugar epimerase